MVRAVRIKDRMLYRTEKFSDVFLIDIKGFLCKLIEGFLVCGLLVELLPSAAQHDLRILRKLKRKAPLL